MAPKLPKMTAAFVLGKGVPHRYGVSLRYVEPEPIVGPPTPGTSLHPEEFRRAGVTHYYTGPADPLRTFSIERRR